MTSAVINALEITMGIVVMATVMDAMGISIMMMTKTINVCFLGACQAQQIWS
jgi:hypothetical protein